MGGGRTSNARALSFPWARGQEGEGLGAVAPPPPCLGHAWAQLTQGPEGLSQPQFPHLQTREACSHVPPRHRGERW